MGGRTGLLVAGVAFAFIGACGGGGDGDDTGATESSQASSTTSAGETASWCDELEGLRQSDGYEVEETVGAPEEIRAPLELLADDAEVDPADDTIGRLVAAAAAVDAWGHEQCGDEHPFCGVWITVNGVIAGSAFSDAAEEEVATEMEAFVGEVDDVLAEHAPDEVHEQVETVLASFLVDLSDEDERAAEAAWDALDEWTWSQGCEGATPPDEAE